MASENLYLEHIVPIYSDRKRVGTGFIVHKMGDEHFVLTCKHVIFQDSSSEYKEKLSVGGKEFNPVVTKNLSFCKGIDLAILTVTKIDDKNSVFLQQKVQNECLTISTYHNINEDKNSFFHKNIDVKIELDTSLTHDDIDYPAYKLKVEDTLEKGYSGSPVFDTNTSYVIGVLSLKEGEDNGYAIDIKNIESLTKVITIETLQDNINLEYGDIARVVFDGTKDKYKITINQNSLFDGNEVYIKEKQSDIIQEIKDYCRYIDNDRQKEREIQIHKVELVIPCALFNTNIGLWEDKNSENLVNTHEVLIRSPLKQNISRLVQSKIKASWNNTLNENNKLKKLSQEVNCNDFMLDTTKVSAHIVKKIDKDTSFEKIINNFQIAIWNNGCKADKEYRNFLINILNKKVQGLPSKFRSLLARQRSCGKNINLMWDDPNTLPKQNYTQPKES